MLFQLNSVEFLVMEVFNWFCKETLGRDHGVLSYDVASLGDENFVNYLLRCLFTSPLCPHSSQEAWEYVTALPKQLTA